MFRKLINCAFLLLGLVVAQHAGAFTLWGPLEAWQTADLDYDVPPGVRYYYFYVEPGFDGIENGGPKNFGEGSRLATPILTYGFDDTFLEYFGAKGVAAVDAAMKVLNALPSASSANLANFITEGAEQVNYTAQALGLLDIKSTVLWLMVEHMGLMGETHVWDLAERVHYAAPACDFEYYVINRNYDPGTYNPSAYVNGRQLGYVIWDGCSNAINVGDAIEIPVDATAPRYTAVATGNGLEFGGYYLNLSRDDMGGLQYLYRKNHYVYQSLDSNSVGIPFSSSWAPIETTNELNSGVTGVSASTTVTSNFVGVLGGVEKITFVKVGFDSVLGVNFAPITYHYTMPYVTNSRLTQLTVTRTIFAPDILFTASDLAIGGTVATDPALARTGTFIGSNYVTTGFGFTGQGAVGVGVIPSTINPSMFVVMNNVGPIYFNYNPFFLDSLNVAETPIFNWGSFDGSSNAPISYPVGSSLADLEAEVLQGGFNVPVSPWNPIPPPTNTTTTGSGGGNP